MIHSITNEENDNDNRDICVHNIHVKSTYSINSQADYIIIRKKKHVRKLERKYRNATSKFSFVNSGRSRLRNKFIIHKLSNTNMCIARCMRVRVCVWQFQQITAQSSFWRGWMDQHACIKYLFSLSPRILPVVRRCTRGTDTCAKR